MFGPSRVDEGACLGVIAHMHVAAVVRVKGFMHAGPCSSAYKAHQRK